jgi:hypothetical protein
MTQLTWRLLIPLFAISWIEWPMTLSKFCAVSNGVRLSGAKILASPNHLILTLRGGGADGTPSTNDDSLQKPLKVEQTGPKSFARRDLLIRLQNEAQKKWDEEKIFEEDAPTDFDPDAPAGNEKIPPKYFCTFPYPYMNGLLHLGHAYSLSKAEFAVGYQRMLGK